MRLHDLPEDILARILEFLDTKTLLLAAPLVCRHWSAVLRQLACVQLDFSFAVREETSLQYGEDGSESLVPTGLAFAPLGNEDLRRLLSTRFRAVWRVHLGSCIDITPLGFADPTTSVRHLDLEYCELEDSDLAELFRRLPNLQFLKAAYCNITNVVLQSLATYCKSLRILRLDDCHAEWDEEGLGIVASSCQSLSGLALNGLQEVPNEMFVSLAEHLSHLRHLEVSAVTEPGAHGHIPTEGIAALFQKCPLLRVSIDAGKTWLGSVVELDDVLRGSLPAGPGHVQTSRIAAGLWGFRGNSDPIFSHTTRLDTAAHSPSLEDDRPSLTSWNCL